MAWIIRTVDTLIEVYYYTGSQQQIFGGDWGNPALYEHIEVEDRPPEINTSQSIVGDYFKIATGLGATSATGTAYIQKIRLTTDELVTGTYRLGFAFSWNITSLSDNFLARIRQNSTTDIWNQASRSSVAMNLLNPSSGSIYLELDAGVYTFDLEFAAGTITSSITVSQAKLEFWRLY